MMVNLDGLKVYAASTMNAGIQVNAADISIGQAAIDALPLTERTYNFSRGRYRGWTSRYGIWPIPGHNSGEIDSTDVAVAPMTGYYYKSLFTSEQAQAAHAAATSFDVYDQRRYVFGTFTINQSIDAAPGNTRLAPPVLYWITARVSKLGNQWQIDLCPSIQTSPGNIVPTVTLASNVAAPIGAGSAIVSRLNTTGTPHESPLGAVDRLHTASLLSLRRVTSSPPRFLRFTTLQKRVSTNIKEMVAYVSSLSDPGTYPYPSFFFAHGGMCPPWINATPTRQPLSLDVQAVPLFSTLSTTAPKRWRRQIYYNSTLNDPLYPGDLYGVRAVSFNDPVGSTNGGYLNHSTTTGWTTTGTFPADPTNSVFIRTSDNVAAVPLTLLAMVTNKPVIVAFNPYVRDQWTTSTNANPTYIGNDYAQWIDPTANLFKPLLMTTLNNLETAPYTEQGSSGAAIAKQTCWQTAHPYQYGTVTGNIVANAGILKANTTYEYAYSIYNALTGRESNVGVPAKAYVDTDGSAIRLLTGGIPPGNGATYPYFPSPMLFESVMGLRSTSDLPCNYLSFRLYFREVGSFEWLFAAEHTFAKLFFEAYCGEIMIGAGDTVGTVGGQPGGYNDYSDLPADNYIDVVAFQSRIFWLSSKALRFSSGDNALSYPVRNYGEPASGENLGMIAHYFPGQAEQSGRLVVFTSTGIDEARFTGELQYEQVRVSILSPPQAVPRIDSDFKMWRRGSETSFSGRTAVVAEGILYFMGPNGIFRDDGVELPKRISQTIEPLYFDSYDKSATARFFAHYNKRSREILFFYVPATTDGTGADNPLGFTTKAWVYAFGTESWSEGVIGAWSQYGYCPLTARLAHGQQFTIDWIQEATLDNFSVAHPAINGSRTLIGVYGTSQASGNESVSRAFFHDEECDGGDMPTGYEVMCKAIQKPSSAVIRLVLADDYSADAVAALSPSGGKIALRNVRQYTKGDIDFATGSAANSLDGYYSATLGSGYIDIAASEVPFTVSAIDLKTVAGKAACFPIFVQTSHAVPCVLDPNYLCPEGLTKFMLARYIHLLLKPLAIMNGASSPAMTGAWQANHEMFPTATTKALAVTRLNARETTTQVIADISSPQMQVLGQAVRTTLTYNQLAGRFSILAMAHYYDSRGAGEIKYYMRT